MSAHLQKLIEHLKWADAAALEALRRSGGSDARTLMIYSHVLGAEAVWIARLAGRPSDVAVWPVLTLEQAASLAARNAAELDAFVARLTPDDLGREIDYRTSDGRAFRSTVEELPNCFWHFGAKQRVWQDVARPKAQIGEILCQRFRLLRGGLRLGVVAPLCPAGTNPGQVSIDIVGFLEPR